MVHGLPRHVIALSPADEPGGVPHRRAPRGHVDEHHGPGTDLGAGANEHVAKNRGPGADEHAVPDLGVPVPHRLSRPAERDVVEDGDVVAHDGGLADDDAGGVVEEDALADGGGRVDVDGEHLGDPGLERERESAAVLRPEHVRDAVGLDGEEEVVEERGEEGGGAELVGEVEGEGALQGRVREHGGVEEGGERRLRVRVAPRLGLDLGPDPGLLAVRLRGRVGRNHGRVERRRAVAALLGIRAEGLAGRHRRPPGVGVCVCNRRCWSRVGCEDAVTPVPPRNECIGAGRVQPRPLARWTRHYCAPQKHQFFFSINARRKKTHIPYHVAENKQRKPGLGVQGRAV
ncbi:hypothetical protein BRADI_2g48426v3 [Brachypodium distachyon]|uniref:Uncharacterized protein n=1 Tax=Brachypodium distachyon TaxID=15368 RepID=A0A2K2DEL0_BRADI|nr:hypothetical protein BRADI_2g48426v3 [Brachypodium distachyon]